MILNRFMDLTFRTIALAKNIFEGGTTGESKENQSHDLSDVAKKTSESLRPAEPKATPLKSAKRTVKSGQFIESELARAIKKTYSKSGAKALTEKETLLGKSSLAQAVWALGLAEKAKITEGMTAKDVCSFLYEAAQIDTYPVSIGKTAHSNPELIVSKISGRAPKRYALTEQGKAIFKTLS